MARVNPDEPNPQARVNEWLAYACSMAADFVRLLLRICSAVNSPPQTPQRQPGDAMGAGATLDPGC